MALFGGFQERREKKAIDHYFAAPSIDAGEVEELKKACPNAGAVLHEVLKAPPERDKRFRALLGLRMLGITPEMVPAVVDALHDEDDLAQEAAARLLGSNPQYADQILPALVALYADRPAVRPVVLEVLTEYGPAGRSAARLLADGLRRPAEALAIARCLARIGADDLDPVARGMVQVLNDRRDVAALAGIGPAFQAALETFLLAVVPWRTVDAIPAWRRVLEAYAEICGRPGDPLLRVLTELVQYSDWKLRGEVGAQFIEMSRAKKVAEKLIGSESRIDLGN